MGCEFVLNDVTIKDVLDDLRKPNGDRPTDDGIESKERITFDDAVINMWQKLKMKGTPNPRLIEYLLISLIEDTYKSGIQKKNKKKARIRDATLLSFGLLSGYPHTKIQEGQKSNTWLEDRYEEYLNNSQFIKVQYSDCRTYQEIKKHWKQSGGKRENPPLNLLRHSAGDGKKEIAPKLLEIFLNKTYNQYLDEDGNIPAFELPEPYFTLKNFPPSTEQDEDSSSDQSLVKGELDNGASITEIEESENEGEEKPIGSNPPEPPPIRAGWFGIFMDKFKMKLAAIKQPLSSTSLHLPKASSITLVIAVFALAIMGIKLVSIIEDMNTTKEKEISQAKEEVEKIVPTKIEIMEKNIILPLGGDGYLKIKTEPSELNLNDLWYTSSNRDVVHMEDQHSNHMIATDDLADNVKNSSEITVQGMDGVAQDTTTVIVGGSQKNEAAIDDKNDDEASSTGFESNIDSE